MAGGHKNKNEKPDTNTLIVHKDELQQIIEEAVNKAVKSAVDQCKAELTEMCRNLCEKLESRVYDLEQENDKLHKLQKTTHDALQSVQQDLISASRCSNNNEQYSRRNMFNLLGCPQVITKAKDHKKAVADLLNSKLGESVCRDDIDVTHPIGKSQNGQSTFIVKFHSRELRDRLMSKRRLLKRSPNMQKTESVIALQDSLSRKNIELLKQVKTHRLIKSAWSWQGTIWALTHKEKKIKCDILMDLDELFH